MKRIKLTLALPKLDRRQFASILCLLVFAVVGSLLVVRSRAASFTASSEAENGSVASCAKKQSDSSASGGSTVKFNPCAVTPPTPPPTPPVGSCASSYPSGIGVSTYQSLSGATFDARVNAAPDANIVSLPEGTFTFSNFTKSKVDTGIWAGADISQAGLIGEGVDRSFIKMNANTSTQAAAANTGGTNQVYLMAIGKINGLNSGNALSGLRLSCFTLIGTNQGHLYNGVRLAQVTNSVFSSLKLVAAAPGNSNVPPGETFALNDYRGGNNTYKDIEIDGAGTGASGIGINGSGAVSNNSFTDINAHHMPYSAGIALWQVDGTQTLTRFKSTNNKTGINIERVKGMVNIHQPTLTGNTSQEFFLGNDQGSGKINIYDPILDKNSDGSPKKMRIWFPVNEQGNPNIQRKSDVKVYVNGVDVSASYIQWLGGGNGG